MRPSILQSFGYWLFLLFCEAVESAIVFVDLVRQLDQIAAELDDFERRALEISAAIFRASNMQYAVN